MKQSRLNAICCIVVCLMTLSLIEPVDAVSVKPLESTIIRQQLVEQVEFLLLTEEANQFSILQQQADLFSRQSNHSLLNEWQLNSWQSNVSLEALTQLLAGYWQFDSSRFNSLPLIERAQGLTPHHPQYDAMRKRAMQLLQIHKMVSVDSASTSKWQIIDFDWVILPQKTHPLLPAIRQRLALLGETGIDDLNSNKLDQSLLEVVKRFQKRHGLKADGIIGKNTLFWLNMLPAERAKLLARNFVRQEKWYRERGDDYLLVNIPQFELSLIHAGNPVMQSRISVGRPYRKTQLIQSEISSLVINPGWNVPKTILRKDLLPKLKDNINYLAEKSLEVYDQFENQFELNQYYMEQIQADYFPYRVYQKPGPDNPLGDVKLHFDNPYAIYLHDTPEKQQFERSYRALSSGCIRVEKAASIARWLALNRGVDIQLWRDSMLDNEKTQWLKLAQPLPVYIVYWTAWMETSNLPSFRYDLYGWEDEPEKLASHWVKPQISEKISIKSTDLGLHASK